MKRLRRMSQLRIYNEDNQATPLSTTNDFAEIASKLEQVGIRIERWKADKELPDDSSSKNIIAAYQAEIDKLVAEGGYQTWDVVSMHPNHPDKKEFRKKFLDEDEVRFFVNGQGLFTIHIDRKIYSMLCVKDDLISVPAHTKHWFDMGPNPRFTAIRLFNNPEGWVANFTGDDIAAGFPLLDN